METMNTPEPAAGEPRDETGDPVETEAFEHEPVVHQVEREVTLVRGVRYGRIVVTFGIVGAVVAMMVSALMPVAPDANYTLGQVVGFMALIGGAVGLGVGGLIGVILGMVAKRRTGSGVAIQTDVR